jgi:hypothetical protein
MFPKHGGHIKLKSFQIARLFYDVTFRVCDRYIEKRSRNNDQMVQVARSNVQNIAESSQASATSRKTELKLKQRRPRKYGKAAPRLRRFSATTPTKSPSGFCQSTNAMQQGNARPRHPPSLNSPVKGGFTEPLRRVRVAHRGGKR